MFLVTVFHHGRQDRLKTEQVSSSGKASDLQWDGVKTWMSSQAPDLQTQAYKYSFPITSASIAAVTMSSISLTIYLFLYNFLLLVLLTVHRRLVFE
jgi:hypothetical protein